jgi:hypothetical protein
MAAYERGDYIKVEFPDETTGVGEWMWVRVTSCDDAKRLVFGTLDKVVPPHIGLFCCIHDRDDTSVNRTERG